MNRPGTIFLAWLLIATVCTGGLDAAVAAAAHADHPPTIMHGPGDDANLPGDGHEDHCCHIAGHLVGAVGNTQPLPAANSEILPNQAIRLILRVREPPPIPPPTR